MGKRRVVLVDRFWAALQARGGTRQQLAEAAGVSHATVSRIASAKGTKEVRAAQLQALSRALLVPPEWLTGERNDLPYVPERPPSAGQDKESPSLWERPTADYVRWSWFMQGVETALRRDLDAWYGKEADDAYNSWGRGVILAFTRLATSMVWRSAALVPSSTVPSYQLWQCDDSPSLGWLMHVLEPWFAGKAFLNAEVLRGLFQAMLASPDVQILGSPIGDDNAVRGLERYAAARRTFAPDEVRFAGLGPEDDE